jgi:5-methylcytosine-specific restriction endonuclease McrA
MYSPQRRQALADVKTHDGKYVCLLCKTVNEKYAMEVDHIIECGALKCLADVEGFVDRLFNGNLQAICKPCHALKRKPK